MLSDEALLIALKGLGSQKLVTLALLHHVEQPAAPKAIVQRGIEVGHRDVSKWNLNDVLSKAAKSGLVAQLPAGWKMLPAGVELLKASGLDLDAPMIAATRHSLNKHVNAVADPERKRFLQEAVACFEAKQWRAAVVFSWVGAAHILQEHVFGKHLAAFNAAGVALTGSGSPKFKDFKQIKSMADFDSLKEADFLQIGQDASVISKSEKAELKERLDLRNRCGHPNPIVVGEHAAANHIEVLILNVYSRY